MSLFLELEESREMLSGMVKGNNYTGRAPQLAAVDAEIKVPSGENTELKRFPFKAWSRSV